MTNVLLVDDDSGFTEATSELITLLGHRVTVADSVSSAKQQITEQSFDVVLLDIMLPDGNGFEVLNDLKSKSNPAKIVFITGHTAVKSVVNSIAGPGVSYLLKPIDLPALKPLLDSPNLVQANDERAHFGVLIGESAPMKSVYTMIERVATTRANVMVMGESGTGKELIAKAIHSASGAKGDLVATNCGALSPELLSSELFGHEKGAFTGAVSRKIGLFERANNGTLFLDEITEMPIDMQPTLLRVLETGMITRVGGTEEIPVNCRVVSATNRTPEQIATENCLREDIYFRLAVFPISLPPLRDREGDIPRLAEYFISELNREHGTHLQLNDALLEKLSSYTWTGNVREFRHTLYRAFILTDPQSAYLQLPPDMGSPFAQVNKDEPKQSGLKAGATIQEVERELIALTLEKVDGDKPKAANMLGISLKTLYNRLNQYEAFDSQ